MDFGWILVENDGGRKLRLFGGHLENVLMEKCSKSVYIISVVNGLSEV